MAYSWQPDRSSASAFIAQISAPVPDGKPVSAGWASGSVGSVNY